MRTSSVADIVAEVLEDYRQTLSYEETAAKFNTTKGVVYRLVIEANKVMEAQRMEKIKDDTFDFVICSHFGCGKHLGLMETLYGNYCPDHQEEKTVLQIVDRYISI